MTATDGPVPAAPASDELPPARVRLRSPTDVCEAIPYLVGFEPRSSLVAISLRGGRRRAGLTVRVDLPDPGLAAELAERVVGHVADDGGRAVVVVAYAEPGDARAGPAVSAVQEAARAAGIDVVEALLVSAGRWTSYLCAGPCCPGAGTPLRDRLTDPGVLAVTMIGEGRQVLPDREAVERSVAPVTGLVAAAMRSALDVELDRFLGAVSGAGRARRADESVELAHALAGRMAAGAELTVDASARLMVGLLDREVRDQCLPDGLGTGRAIGPPDAALELWRLLVRRAVVPGLVAPVATLLAASAYLDRGDGALANVALDRALADTPSYLMAQYLRIMLDGGLSPTTVRARAVAVGPGRTERRQSAG